MRDVNFLDELDRLLVVERDGVRALDAERRKELTLVERAARGVAILDLVAVDERWGMGGRLLVELEAPRTIEGTIDSGALVELRSRRDPDVEPARGVVARRADRRLVVAFDRPPAEFVTSGGRLVAELLPDEVSFNRMRAALATVRAMESGAARRRRDVLLGAAPRTSIAPSDRALDDTLNPEQREAVTRALSAEDFFLVHGPPGTGKSTVLVAVAVEEVRRGQRVLGTAASNAAVDHVVELSVAAGLRTVRIGHPARVAERLARYTLDVLVEDHDDQRLARELYDEAHGLLGYARRQRTQGRAARGERFANAREAGAEARKLFDEARRLERRAVKSVLDGAEVVCATLTALHPHGDLGDRRFDLALVDEATQATEPATLLAFLRAPRLVMGGDHKQLPPTVKTRAAVEGGLARSLFERLVEDHGDSARVLLREQHRMNERIMAFPSLEMYGGALRAHPRVAHRELKDLLTTPLDAPPLLFVDTAGKGWDDELAPGSDSRRNPGEAELVLARLVNLLDAGLPPSEIAVIAPYRAQVTLLRELAAAVPSSVEIDTIDAFQGREKEAVLVSLVRANSDGDIGFLADLRRINVALTRARRHLFIVGDSATVGRHPFYARLIEHVQKDGGYRSAWEWPVPGEAT